MCKAASERFILSVRDWKHIFQQHRFLAVEKTIKIKFHLIGQAYVFLN